ncbi:MAG: hypothetical protein HYX31_23815 [Mycobacterium sp.]|nr:hypothetical protein [Mycobacterium sp.]
MAELVAHVALFDPKGNLAQFAPGDDVPAWARKKLTNPAVWDSEPAEDGGSGDGPPPQSGRGSSRDAWASYAEAHGVDADGKDRDEIIAACQEAGVAVE